MTAEEVRTKVCNVCNEEKNYMLFDKNRRKCKGCMSVIRSVYYNNNREAFKVRAKIYRDNNQELLKVRSKQNRKRNEIVIKASKRRYYDNNKDKIREYKKAYSKKNRQALKDKRLSKLYDGMSIKKYNEMLKSQNNCCKICKKHKSDFKKALSIDHCHETGDIRGILCSNCNTAIGLFGDNVDNIRNAIAYLRFHRGSSENL